MEVRSDADRPQAGGRMIVDGGYFDLQVNGGWGRRFSVDPAAMWSVGERLLQHGVTDYLPTLTSDGFGQLDRALDELRVGPPHGWVGARPVGLHLEGPWLNPERRGAHPAGAIRPVPEELPARLTAADGVLLVTLAPEMFGAIDLIRELCARGVAVSMGHSEATLAEAIQGAEAGSVMGTHLFNAMSGLHHREPGLAAALLDDRLGMYVGLIADGHHVVPKMVRLAWRLAAERIVLVSDATQLLGESDALVATLNDGTLAGSVMAIDSCVRNLRRFVDCDLSEAAAAASALPRALLGMTATQGTQIEIDDDGFVIEVQLDSRLAWRRADPRRS